MRANALYLFTQKKMHGKTIPRFLQGIVSSSYAKGTCMHVPLV